MKKLILCFLLIGNALNTIGQCQEGEVISTNPDNPINTDLSEKLHPFPGSNATINEYLNTWKWAKWSSSGGNHSFDEIDLNPASDWLQNGQSIPANSSPAAWRMSSPFGFNMMTHYPYLLQGWNGSSHPQDKDWRWEDGWELMWLNTGYFPNQHNFPNIGNNPIDPSVHNMNSTNNNRIHTGTIGLANKSAPFFALYNRYTGKLRFFGNYFFEFGTSNPKFIDLRLYYDFEIGNLSGIFRHAASYDQALDQYTKVSNLFSTNVYPGTRSTWFVSDFQLGYDPCVCNYKSYIKREYKLINTWDVDLFSRTMTFNSVGLDEVPNDFLNTRDDVNGEGNATFSYKYMAQLHDKYEAELSSYESKLATYNKPQNVLARDIISLAKTVAVSGISGGLAPSEAIKENVSDFMKKIDGNFDKENEAQMVKGIKKTADALIGKGVDYLVKQYVNTDIITQPVKPTMPTVTLSESRISGTISHSSTHDLQSTFTPGSFVANGVNSDNIEEYNYPIYNKPTGLYALLKTPKIALGSKQSNDSVISFYHGATTFGGWSSVQSTDPFVTIRKRTGLADFMVSHTTTQDIVFYLEEGLLYKLNRNLDINDEKSNLLVSFQLELKGQLPSKFHGANSQLGERRLEVALVNSNFEVLNHETEISSTEPEKLLLEIPWDKIEKVTKNLYSVKLSLTSYYKIREDEFEHIEITDKNPLNQFNPIQGNNHKITNQIELKSKSAINTNLVSLIPIDHLSNFFTIHPKSLNRELHYSIKSLKMKVMTDLTFNQISSKGGEINTVQSFTYLLYDKDKNIDLIESHGRWLSNAETENFARNVNFPDLILLGNETIHTGSPHVTFQEGNTLYVRANKIHVQGHLLIQSGFRVVLYATEEVKLLQGARINADTKIQIGDRFVRFPWKKKIYEATSDEVFSFCNQSNNEYKANQSNARLVPNDGEQNQEDTLVEEEIRTEVNNEPNPSVLYPNPNIGVFTIGFERNLEENAVLTIMDMSGRKVASNTLANGQNTFSLDYSSLSSGVYMVQIVYKQNKSTHKLVLREVH